ncbi:MAG: hypothetical protein NTW19_01265 [Planctomycetota bacterium]|nr:hypothetical protein [Planctomycetota bacterium]
MQEMTSTKWKRRGSSIVWHADLLADLVRDVEPVSVRALLGWLNSGFPDSPPETPGNPGAAGTSAGGTQTVLVGGLQTVVETMMQTHPPEAVAEWLRTNALAVVRAWKSHWPNVGLVFVMDGPGTLFEFNEGDELVYFGRGRDRSKKVKLSSAIWNGAASGAGAYQLIVEKTGGREVGGYYVGWLS